MDSSRYFIYINWDGFGYYYYKLANEYPYKGTPYINSLARNGVLFTDAYTGIPSITCPMQTAIVTGAYSNVTKNVYKYFDRGKNEVVLCKRSNEGQTIGEVLAEENICFASIQQFTLEGRGADRNNTRHLYIQPEGDYSKRFEEAKAILKGNNMECKPKVLFIYMDDLDTIGHNRLYGRGKFKAFSEKRRIENVISHLIEMDAGLGEFIEFLNELGIYERTNILLTTDHGMVSFTGKGQTYRIIEILEDMGFEKILSLDVGELPPEDWDVIMVGTSIQLQLYFREPMEDRKLDCIKREIEKVNVVEKCMTKRELEERGTANFFADILISPFPPHHFSTKRNRHYTLKANHDSLNDKAQHIFAVLSGPDFKRNVVYSDRVYNIDFIPTICYAMDIPLPKNATGRILTNILANIR